MEYIVNHIPRTTPCDRRPGLAMAAEYITIHNTGNANSTALNERLWLTNPSNDRKASYHIVIDQNRAIECLPLTEVGWHAGDGGSGTGNRKSIGIEICESGNYAQTLQNAARLVAELLKERGWGVDRLRRHYDWSSKICPRLMYDKGTWAGWTTFKNMVRNALQEGEPMTPQELSAFKELQGQVATLAQANTHLGVVIEGQAKQIKALQDRAKLAEVPAWAQAAVDAAVAAGVIDTKQGSHDFYRLLTITHRAGVFK